MPVDSITQARDEMHAAFMTPWLAATDVPVLFHDRSQELPSDRSDYARITVRHTEGANASLAGANGQRLYRHRGTVTVQIFTASDDGQRRADELAQVAKLAFQGKVTSPGGVIFRRARINEVGPSGAWFQTNVLADFEYDEVQ